MADFLRHATTNVRNPDRKEGEELIPMREFRKELRQKMEQLRMDPEFARRYVNDGFSGGEMKRAEILQLAMLQPKFAILDETDSGLDADAVRLASQSIAEIGRRQMGLLIITHHDKLLEHNRPDFTHVMLGGRIVETGGVELAAELHSQGYDRIRRPIPRPTRPTRQMLEEGSARCTPPPDSSRTCRHEINVHDGRYQSEREPPPWRLTSRPNSHRANWRNQ